MSILRMSALDLHGKRVLIREDLNVPVKEGRVKSDARLLAALPTIRAARDAGARIMLLSHLGRPVEGEYSEENSLAPVAVRLAELLGSPVRFAKDYLQGLAVAEGEVVLCENVRFNKGEKKDDETLGKQYAALCDVFVMDAFATAHRAQASTSAVARFAPVACAGPLLAAELEALQRSFENAQHPLLAIIGGSKVSTKLTVLESLTKKVDQLIVGGGIANNFLKAAGFEVGRSLFEPELVEEARKLMEAATARGSAIPLPVDVVVGTEFSETSPATIKKVADVTADDMILDIGPETAALYDTLIRKAKTIIWNGPVGAFEVAAFSKGTEALCHSVAGSSAFSIAGGGDTLAAVEKYGVSDQISYLSTGGGAFLEFLEGKVLPAVAVLEKR